MKQFLCFLSIIVLSKLCFTQVIKPFVGIDGHYGIRNKVTGKTLIDTKFKRIEQYNDSMIVVVDDKGNYAIIDTLEHILLPYSKYSTGFIDYDSVNISRFIESPYRNDKGEISYYTYIVYRNRNCISSDYYKWITY
ncbi:MAG: hypothetical protein Q8907_15010 [Bacteroidota bacterium]|nr:hypothetical protein [Bacteroidota bacterium]